MRRPSLKSLVLEAALCADMPIPCLQPEAICKENFFSVAELAIYILAPYSLHDNKSQRDIFPDPLASNYILFHFTVVAVTATCNRYAFTRFNQPILIIELALPARHYLFTKSALLFLPGKLLSGDG